MFKYLKAYYRYNWYYAGQLERAEISRGQREGRSEGWPDLTIGLGRGEKRQNRVLY